MIVEPVCTVEDRDDVFIVVNNRMCSVLKFATCKFQQAYSNPCHVEYLGERDYEHYYVAYCDTFDPERVLDTIRYVASQYPPDRCGIIVLRLAGLRVRPVEEETGGEP